MKDLLDFIIEKKDIDVVDEALTVQQRNKRAQIMRRNAKKIAKKRKIKERRMKSPEELKTKARKAARLLIFKKLAKGRTPSEVSQGERMSIEKKVDKKKAVIGKLVKKMLPKMKKAEKERVERVRGKSKDE